MGPTFVTGQQQAGSSATSSVGVSFPSNVTAGNTIRAGVACDSNTVPSGTAVSDNNGNSYSLVKSEAGITNSGASGACATYEAINANAGPTTVTFNNTGNAGGANFIAISITEITTSLSTADTTNGNHAGTTGTPNAGNLVTTNSDDYLFAVATNAQADTTWSAGSGWNLRACINSSANTTIGCQDQSVASTNTYSSAFGNTTTNQWSSAADAVKANPAANGPTTLPSLGIYGAFARPPAAGWLG